jgi:hypothetical protein
MRELRMSVAVASADEAVRLAQDMELVLLCPVRMTFIEPQVRLGEGTAPHIIN